MSEPQRATPLYLTADQADSASFPQVRKGGYDMPRVDAFVASAASSIRWLNGEVADLEAQNAQLRTALETASRETEAMRSRALEDSRSLAEALARETLTADLATAAATELHERLGDEIASRPSASAAVEVVAMAHTTARATLDAANDKAAALVESARCEAQSRRESLEEEMAAQVERLRELAQVERELRAALAGVVQGVHARINDDILANDVVVAEIKRHLDASAHAPAADHAPAVGTVAPAL